MVCGVLPVFSLCASLLRFVLLLFPVGASVSAVTAPDSGTTALSFYAEQNTDIGTLPTVQPPMLPLQCNPEDSNSLNTTMQGKKRQIF